LTEDQRQRLIFHDKQNEIFFESKARYKVIAKGRRFGLTRGFANYVIESMTQGVGPVLWIDTVYGNIERYVERYFLPVLKELPKNLWKYRGNRNDLKINGNACDFRSADRPENIEGFGYALIIINEAGIVLKNRRLWEESIRPMIMDYKAKVLIGGTPKGKVVKRTNEKHLFYELFERGNHPGLRPPLLGKAGINTNVDNIYKDWESFNYSSYDNPFLDTEEIDQMVLEISPSLRDQEVFGKFVDKEGKGIISSSWWKFYDPSTLYEQKILKKIQSWDTAFKANEGNDFSVCTTWVVTPNGYYLTDLFRERLEFPELKRKAVTLFEAHKVNEVLIEDKASGQSLIQELKNETRLPIKPVKVDADKIARVHSVTPLIEAGKVYLPLNAPWVKDFVNECEDFPDAEFDDMVDSVSQFLNYVRRPLLLNSSDPIIHVSRRNILSKYKAYR
jgi:predicted phage terminase large subunit-like protein